MYQFFLKRKQQGDKKQVGKLLNTPPKNCPLTHINPKHDTKCPLGYCTQVFQMLYITYYKFHENHNDLRIRFQEVSILLS